MAKQQQRIFYPARLSFRIEGEIKNFSDKQKLKEYSNIKHILKEIYERSSLKGARNIYRKGKIPLGKANI